MNSDHMIAFGFYFVLKWTLGFDQSAKDCNIGLLQHVHNSRIANIIFFISLNLIQILTFYKLEFTKCSSLCFTAHSECFLATRSQCVAQIFQPCPRLDESKCKLFVFVINFFPTLTLPSICSFIHNPSPCFQPPNPICQNSHILFQLTFRSELSVSHFD